jgi:hypothetical protein
VMIMVPMIVVLSMRCRDANKRASRQSNGHDNGAGRPEPQHHDAISSLRGLSRFSTTDDRNDLQLAQK